MSVLSAVSVPGDLVSESVRPASPPRAASALERTLIVVVSWNSEPHLGTLLPSIPRGSRVTVVDNASTDATARLTRLSAASLLRLDENIGFGPACNHAVLEESSPFDAVLLLNPDTEWLDGEEGLETLFSELFRSPRRGGVAPALVGDGQEEFQLRRLPTLASLFRECFLVNRLWPGNPWLRKERYLDRRRGEPIDVEQPAAAALLVRADVFRQLGGFDPRFFPAWFEDVDLCARLKESGFSIRFVPSVRVRHSGGSTMRTLAYRDYLPLYTRNLFRYLQKHESPGRVRVARLILAAGCLLRIVLLLAFKGDHSKKDGWAAYYRVLRGLSGSGWKTSLAPLERT